MLWSTRILKQSLISYIGSGLGLSLGIDLLGIENALIQISTHLTSVTLVC